jgi:hypothetical protein
VFSCGFYQAPLLSVRLWKDFSELVSAKHFPADYIAATRGYLFALALAAPSLHPFEITLKEMNATLDDLCTVVDTNAIGSWLADAIHDKIGRS